MLFRSDADEATYDWSHLEVVAVGPSNEQLTATINDVTGASASVAATASGEWAVVARSVSRAEKRSLDGDAGTVDVELVGLTGAINDAIGSANGKNTVTYAEVPPTPADEGIVGDTWWVGSADSDTENPDNVLTNGSFEGGTDLWNWNATRLTVDLSTDAKFGDAAARLTATASATTSTFFYPNQINVVPGQWAGFSQWVKNVYGAPYVRSRVIFYNSSNSIVSSPYVSAMTQAGGDYTQIIGAVEVPATAAYGYFYIYLYDNAGGAAPSAGKSIVTDGWVIAFDSSQVGALSKATQYFLQGGWNIIEQWQYALGGWTQVELSHEVIATVDLGKATVGELDGVRIMGQTVRGEQLSGDAIDGKVITGANVRTSAAGARVQLDAGGVRVFDSSDNARTQLSPSGNTFKGEVEAETLVVNGGAELKSADNTLAQGAKLTLASGVTDPTAPPSVQPFWGEIAFAKPEGTQLYGLAHLDGKYWTFSDSPGVSGGDALISIDPGTGQIVDTKPSEDFWAAGGMTAVGGYLYALGRKAGADYKYFVRAYTSTGVFLYEWEYVHVGWSPTNKLAYTPGIGNDGTNIVIAHCDDSGSLIWRTYNRTTGALISTVDTGDNTRSNISGVYVGNADWGSRFVAVAKSSTSMVHVFTTSGAHDASQAFSMASDDSVGIAFADGKFRTLSQTGVIHDYVDSNMGDGGGDWWATYRWSVDNDDDGINDSVSRIGPVKRFTWPKRSRLRFLGAPLPVGVGYITPSIARKSTTPSRTDFRTPSFSVYVGESEAWYDSLPSDWQSGPAPSDSNDFPDAEPSTLVSASSTFQVNGDGSGKWGPLTFNPDGTMSSSAVPEWVPVTTFASGFGPQTWGDVPSYRIWPDGKVEWRGVIAGAIGPGGISFPILTIPSGARPGRPKNKAAACSGSGVLRVEFGPTSDVTKLYVYPDAGTRTWVSIDELYYYLP